MNNHADSQPGGTYKKFVLDEKANTFKLEDATQDLLGLASVVRVRNIQINADKGENVPTVVEGDNCILRIAEKFTWAIKVGDELRCIPYWLYPDSRYPSYETPNGTIAIYKWMAGTLGSVHYDEAYRYTYLWWWKKPKTWWWTERKNWIKRLLPYEARLSIPGKEGVTSRHRTMEDAKKAIERIVCDKSNWHGVS